MDTLALHAKHRLGVMNRRKLIRKHALIIDHRTKLKEKDRILTIVCDDGTQRQAAPST